MAIKLTPAGVIERSNRNQKLSTRLATTLNLAPNAIEREIFQYQRHYQQQLYRCHKSILQDEFDISEPEFCECPITYLKRNCNRINNHELDILGYNMRHTINEACDILKQWNVEPHFTGTQNHTLRSYLWLQILDIITQETMLLRPVKLKDDEVWCPELGLAIKTEKAKLARHRHSYRPIVSNDHELFKLMISFLDRQDQNLLDKIPGLVLGVDPKEYSYYYLETGEEYKPTRAKKQKWHHPGYMICSNCQTLFDYFTDQLSKIVSPHAWAQQHNLNLHRHDVIKILNLDTNRMCIRPGKEYQIDDSRRIASKNSDLIAYYADLIVPVDKPPKTPAKPKSSIKSKPVKPGRPRKQTIPVDIRLKVWEKYNPALQGHCFVCCDDLHYRNHHSGHIQAEAKGGQISLTNLVPICQQCNLVMGTTHLIDFVAQGRLEYLKDNEPLKQLIQQYRPEIINKI